jgi:hypothetical protein
MIVRIYGELYDLSIDYFNSVEIIGVKEYISTVFIDVEKDNKKITMSMSLDDYKTIDRHRKISELGIKKES